MSSNQKQTVTGGPSRYPAPYQPHNNNRTDILLATPPGYVTQGNQAGNQGPSIRGIAPAGPPNQASTPPNTDLKGQPIPQQPIYISRPQGGTFYQARANGPPSQAPRMQNHNTRPQQPVYGQPTQFLMSAPTYIMSNPMPYAYSAQQRPQANYVQPTIPIYSGPPTVTYPSFQNTPQPQVPQFYYNTMIQRGTSIPQPPPANPNPPQTAISSGAPLVKPQSQAPTYQQQRAQHKRRPNAIAIIDPQTGEDQLDKIYDEDSSHPPSGESSARETPQPHPNLTHKQEVQATFAKMVFQALQDDSSGPRVIPEEALPERQHTDPSPVPYTLPPQQQPVPQQQQQSLIQHSAVSKDHIVQSSKLQPMAKEFEPPVVSANCDSVEVTLPNKMTKDRESPVKRSKPKEQPAPREHRDSSKESLLKESICDKQSSIIKDPEVKPKEVSSSNTTNLPPVPVQSKDSIKENNSQSQDKRAQRKDSAKLEVTNTPNVETNDVAAPTSPIQTTQPNQDNSAKSKPNTSRPSSKQPVAPNQQQHQPQASVQNNSTKPVQMQVPLPQPAKLSNKSHKKNELNQKGASKEGTDMDAFNDNIIQQEEVNANIASKTTNNDIINANSVPLVNNNSAATVKDINVNIETSKTFDSNDLTIKTDTIKPIKTKIDITDIVKDTPKPIIKRTIDSHDETDRAAISNDKLVQAKNEANTKTNDNMENKLPYKDGQWTPSNPSGDKVYDRGFLMALQNVPSSRQRPDNIPDGLLADDRGRLPDGRPSMGSRGVDMPNPPYNNFGGKSGSQRGPPPQRNSKNKISDKRKQPSMKLSLSVREDVKLHEAENAWRPARFAKGENATDDDKKTEELYKKVRGVLNKLTPQKFETLLSQIKSLQIDTQSRLQGVIDLVFEKAVDEPSFSVAYALMCSELALMQVPTPSSTIEKPEVVNFRKLLINRCQVEFEKQSHDETVRIGKLKEIQECTDPEKKKDLQFDLEEYDRKLRMKSVGNIRFIGELFKQNMLTVNIMMKCLKNLLDNKDEESLECLCKLLTTIGKELETKGVDLSPTFSAMKNIAEKKDGNVSSRIRFMLHDVIDLKNSKWIPRRQDHNPKTIDQIQKEADQEQLNIQLMHSAPLPPRRDDRVNNMGSGQNTLDRKGNRGNRNNASDQDGWMTSTRARTNQLNIQSDKLKNKAPLMDEPLGNPFMFGSWSKGSGGGSMGKPQPQSLGPNKANMFAALENIETERRTLSQRPGSKDPYSSKGPSMERSYNKYDGSGSRSGSQHRSNDSSSSSSQRSTPASVLPRILAPANPQQPAAPTTPSMTEEQMERRIGNCADEYANGNCSIDEFYLDIGSVIPVSFHSRMVGFMYSRVLEKSQHLRLKTGYLLAKLVKLGNVSLEDYCNGLEEILSQGDDLVIDVPKIWDYIAEIIVDLVCEEVLSIDRLKKCLNLLGSRNSAKVLTPLFKLVVEKNGAVFLQSIWKKSGARLNDFIDSSEVDRFVADNHLEFLTGSTASIEEYNVIEKKLLELFKSNADFDTVVEWIKTNVGDNVNQRKFIRTLATAVFRDSIDPNYKLSSDRLSQHMNLLTKYVDNNADYELQCLYALQALIQKLEHPQGLLLSICDKLYEIGAFAQESFIAWENSPDPGEQEGKGVAIKQLTSFFTQLKENDDEESDESDA